MLVDETEGFEKDHNRCINLWGGTDSIRHMADFGGMKCSVLSGAG